MEKKSNLDLISKNSIRIKYKITEKNKKTKIFGYYFVINNKNLCKMIIDNKEYDLEEYFYFDNTNELMLINVKNINNIDYMFEHCDSLLDISNFDNLTNIIKMKHLFYGCKSLLSLPDISKLDTSNIKDMSFIFSECKSLLKLPDISKWDTNNVLTMSCMFYECESLILLPDISNWNIGNVENMSCMFYKCKSLIELPDISKWNTSKVIQMFGMFEFCRSISILPDIGKWDTSSLKNTKFMFENCESLCKFPNISLWNTSNLINSADMFNNCISLPLDEEIFKIKKELLNGYSFQNCINFSKNLYDNYIDILLEEMINENEFGREIVEQIFEEIDASYNITCFLHKFDVVKYIIKYQCDKDKIQIWIEKIFENL